VGCARLWPSWTGAIVVPDHGVCCDAAGDPGDWLIAHGPRGGGHRARPRCNRPWGHDGTHRHYWANAELAAEWL
jgi:hypothetical protein